MNVALILAGGHGSRTAQDIPKQFMNVYEKPLIVYDRPGVYNQEIYDIYGY